MTHNSIHARHAHRQVTALLLAAVALPSIAYAQETVTPPVVLVPAPSAPVPAQPAPVAAPAASAGQSRTTIAPGVAEQAQQEARERAVAQRAARPAPVQRSPAPIARTARAAAAPALVAEPAPVAPIAAAPATPPADPAPSVATPAEPAAPAVTEATTERGTSDGGTSWLLLAALGAIAGAVAAVMLLRRRKRDETFDDYDVAPVAATPIAEPLPVDHPPAAIAPKPAAAAPLFVDRPAVYQPQHEPEVHAALEHATLTEPNPDDIDAVLGGVAPQGDRPQLELAMRPIRAGINRDDGVVEFELTIANAGGVSAEEVRIGAFMLSGQPGENATIERLLVDPPADSVVETDDIAPGGGTRIDAAVTLPRDDLYLAEDGAGHAGFTPVVLADARYRLPDGSEGRTAAAFTIGRVNGGEALVPIALDDEAAMYADIEARLHSVPAKV